MIEETRAYLKSISPAATSLLLTTCKAPTQHSYQTLRISPEVFHLIEVENTEIVHDWQFQLANNSAHYGHRLANETEKTALIQKIRHLMNGVITQDVVLLVEKEETDTLPPDPPQEATPYFRPEISPIKGPLPGI